MTTTIKIDKGEVELALENAGNSISELAGELLDAQRAVDSARTELENLESAINDAKSALEELEAVEEDTLPVPDHAAIDHVIALLEAVKARNAK